MFAAKNELLTMPSGGYRISRSLRFRSLATAYLSRTPSSNGDRQKFTWSGWVKRGALASASPQFLMGSGTNGTNDTSFYFTTADKIDFYTRTSSTIQGYVTTNAVFRDPSAFYHVVVVYDSANATAANRMLIYVNGVSQSLTVNNTLPQYTNGFINATVGQYIGTAQIANYLDGYLAEVNFIDGDTKLPTAFGAYDTNGVWQPIACTVSDYGKNGFYLPFSDSANIFNDKAAIATNHSAANNWTNNNLQVATSTATTYDYMIDSPTNYADGGNGRGNYPVLNPINGNSGTFSAANLQFVGPTNWSCVPSTILIPSTGKWFVAATFTGSASGNTTGGEYAYLGVAPPTVSKTAAYNSPLGLWIGDTGWVYNFSATGSNSGSSFSVNNEVLFAVDRDANTYAIYKNGSSVATGTIGTTSGADLMFVYGSYSSSFGQMALNFGQRPLANAAPSSFSALNTQNLPAPALTPSP